jgi:nucleoside-diphosphate-sugar epimerase
MTYFVTGATGFIGRFPRRQARRAQGHDLRARAQGLDEEVRRAARALGRPRERVVRVVATSRSRAWARSRGHREAQGKVRHFFHLAAIYDLSADAASQEQANIDGTRNAVELRRRSARLLPPS